MHVQRWSNIRSKDQNLYWSSSVESKRGDTCMSTHLEDGLSHENAILVLPHVKEGNTFFWSEINETGPVLVRVLSTEKGAYICTVLNSPTQGQQ